MALTIKDIAQLAGVSRGTVDRVIHKRGRVASEVEDRINKIIKECNYHPNVIGRQLALKQQKIKIGFLSKFDYNGFWSIVNRSAADTAKNLSEYGFSVEFKYFDNWQPEIQLSLINELEESGINALIIVPMECNEIADRLNMLSKKGIKIVLLNSEIENVDNLCYIGSDYYVAGKTAAGLLHNFNKANKLNILILNGSKYLSSHRLRKNGFLDEINQLEPNADFIESKDITNDPDYAYHQVMTMLKEHPEINAIYTVPDNAAAVGKAIKDSARIGSLIHIGFSMTDATRPFILEGAINALIGQRAEIQGRLPFEVLLNYFATNTNPEKKRNLMLNDVFIKQNSVF